MSATAPDLRTGFTNIVTTAALTVSILGMSISLAALVFTGPLEGGLPRATGAFVVGAGVTVLLLSRRSGLSPVLAITQDAPAVVMAAVAANLVTTPDGATADDVVVSIALVTVITGAVMFAVGRSGQGHIVRFLPRTVVSGFIAGTGWLLCRGGIDVMTPGPLNRDTFGDLFESAQIERWLPGIVLGVTVVALGRSSRLSTLAASAAVVVAAIAFFAITAITSSIDAVEAEGWLMGPFTDSTALQLVTPAEVGDAPWSGFGEGAAGIASVVLISLVALLLNLSGLEALTRRRVDIDRELTTVGLGNLIGAPFGALPSFHGLGDTELARRMGVAGSFVPAAVGVLAIVFGVVGVAAVGFVPRLIPGGLLIATGLGLLLGWMTELRRVTARIEQLLSIGILVVIATIGILEGVVLGVLAACVVFVWRYSQVDAVRHDGSALSRRSRVDRTPDDERLLDALGDRIAVYELQGYLFFGSVVRLGERVRLRCEDPQREIDEVVFDLTRVTGVDASAAVDIDRIVDDLHAADVAVRFAGGQDSWIADLSSDVSHHTTMDRALAESERTLIGAHTAADHDHPDPTSAIGEVLRELPVERAPAGTTVMQAGDPSDQAIYLLVGGAAAFAAGSDGERHRLSAFSAPAWIGEVGFLRDMPRSADVVADTDIEFVRVDATTFQQFLDDEPERAVDIVRSMAIGLADRTARLSASLTRALE